MTMALILFHGRKTAGDQLDDWGFDGPVLAGVVGLTVTYLTHMRVSFDTPESFQQARAETGWEVHDAHECILDMPLADGLVVTKDGYFGDWALIDKPPLQAVTQPTEKEKPMELAEWQKTILRRYGSGDFAYLAEQHVVTPKNLRRLGDTLLTFVLVETSKGEDCESSADALDRMRVARNDLTEVIEALEDSLDYPEPRHSELQALQRGDDFQGSVVVHVTVDGATGAGMGEVPESCTVVLLNGDVWRSDAWAEGAARCTRWLADEKRSLTPAERTAIADDIHALRKAT